MKTRLCLVAVVIAAWAADAPRRLTAQPSPPARTSPDTLSVVDQIGGAIHAVAIQEAAGCGIAFVGAGPRLATYDVCDAGRPRDLGRSAPLADVVLGVALAGSHAYVAAGRAGLRVFDVADPARLVEVGAVDVPPDNDGEDEALGVAVDGHLAFVALGARGVAVIDVTDPAHPREAGRWHVPFRGTAFAVASHAGHVYVADGDAGLVVLDVAAPADPREVGALGAVDGQPLFATAVVAAGTTVFVTGGPHLWSVDVADPASPRPAGPPLTDPLTDGKALALSGGDLFVVRVAFLRSAAYALRLQRVDARAPGALRQVASDDVPMPCDDVFALNTPRIGLAVAGGFVWMANASHGLEVLKILDPPAFPDGPFRMLVGVGSATRAEAVVPYGAFALVPNADMDVQVYEADAAARGALRYAGKLAFAGHAVDVAVEDGIAYVAAGDLVIVDVSAFQAGQQILALARLTGAGGAIDVAARAGRAYVADLSAGVEVVDVSNPRRPASLGSLPGIDRAEAVAIDAGRLVVGTGARVAVFDLADKDHPVLIAAADTPGLVEDVAIRGDDIVAGGDGAGLTVFHLAADGLTQVGHLQTDVGPHAIAVDGDRVYLASGVGGLQIVDIAARGAPRLAGAIPLPGDASGVAVDGSRVLVAARGGGVWVLGDPAAVPTPGAPGIPSPTATRVPGMRVGAWLPLACVGSPCAAGR